MALTTAKGATLKATNATKMPLKTARSSTKMPRGAGDSITLIALLKEFYSKKLDKDADEEPL